MLFLIVNNTAYGDRKKNQSIETGTTVFKYKHIMDNGHRDNIETRIFFKSV